MYTAWRQRLGLVPCCHPSALNRASIEQESNKYLSNAGTDLLPVRLRLGFGLWLLLALWTSDLTLVWLDFPISPPRTSSCSSDIWCEREIRHRDEKSLPRKGTVLRSASFFLLPSRWAPLTLTHLRAGREAQLFTVTADLFWESANLLWEMIDLHFVFYRRLATVQSKFIQEFKHGEYVFLHFVEDCWFLI